MPKSALKSVKKVLSKGTSSSGLTKAAVPETQPISKQARVLEMLQSGAGATIDEMAQETGWQEHSVRGFLAGVVRKKLGLSLQSKKVEGERTYRIASGAKTKPSVTSKKRRV